VETHRVNIMKKLNARNTAETIKIAAQQGLID
jgi:DNA-binding NarL/FixJ family response regulator